MFLNIKLQRLCKSHPLQQGRAEISSEAGAQRLKKGQYGKNKYIGQEIGHITILYFLQGVNYSNQAYIYLIKIVIYFINLLNAVYALLIY